MIDGILLVDKQVDITSYDVIRKLKKILDRGQKIGHAGTLDPFASGLLIVLLGRATKLMNQVHELSKEYTVTATLGFSTDTQDITGEVLEKNVLIPDLTNIQECIKENFVGDILQTAPKYSAKKINGKKAYELARKGIEFEIEPKQIRVDTFEILEYNYPTLICNIVCSTGTYVRTLINDLGSKLGCYATASALRRNSIGDFSVSQAVNSEDISTLDLESLSRYVIDIDKIKKD